MKLDSKLIDVFCLHFGEGNRSQLSAETDMDDVESWDSLSYIDFVIAIEDAYDLEFTETESAQMFQLGHIQRIINSAKHDIPLDDILHAYSQLKLICDAPKESKKLVLLSGSSTREGLLSLKECNSLLKAGGGESFEFFNLSVSGLVVAEALQLVEALIHVENMYPVIGFSPIILAGCGRAEFERSIERQRFRMQSPLMEKCLTEEGYADFKPMPALNIGQWAARYLNGTEIEDLKYNPYIYPTLEPWGEEKLSDEQSILRYYNQAPLNFEESIRINERMFYAMSELCKDRGVSLGLMELTLHSKTTQFLEELGNVGTRSKAFLDAFVVASDSHFFRTVERAGVVDADFRDPGHLFQKKEAYTKAFLDEAIAWIKGC
mgnify:CR=1 FL=1